MVQKIATLHEKSVQKVARGEHVTPRRRRTPKPSTKSAVRAFRIDDLDPLVRAEVKKQKIHIRHLQVISSTDVVVWNHPAPWPGVRG